MPTPTELLAGADGVGLQLVVVTYGNRRLAVLNVSAPLPSDPARAVDSSLRS